MASRSRLSAIINQRCPLCLEGEMFRSLVEIHERCPVCGHRFMREPGYFQGAMYVSYTLALGTMAVLLLASRHWLGAHIGVVPSYVVAMVLQMVLVIPLFRYSRVIWAHVNIGTRRPDEERPVDD